MAGERVERRLAAVLAADIAGYSRLMGADEVGALAALGEPDRVFAPDTVARSKFELSDIARLTNLGSRTSLAL